MAGPRRRSREMALQILFQLDASPELTPQAALGLYFEHLRGGAGDEGEGDAEAPGAGSFSRELVEEIVLGVAGRRAELDEIITTLSKSWRLERMAQVDRNVMRLALYELKYRDDIPAPVSINEAIELARRYGTVEAGAFVNGLLDRALTELSIKK